MFPRLRVRLVYINLFEFPAVEKRSRRYRLGQRHRRLRPAGSQSGQELRPGWMAERRSWGTKATCSLVSVPGVCSASHCLTQPCLPFRRSVSTGKKRALETISLGNQLHFVPYVFMKASLEVSSLQMQPRVICWHTSTVYYTLNRYGWMFFIYS